MKAKSLLLVTVDCLRADHVGFLGYSCATTPFLDSLAKESLVFSAAIAGGSPTYYSLPAILASRSALALGRDLLGIAPGEETLASALHNAGYATAAFTAANPYISRRTGYDTGFDEFRDFLNADTAGANDERHAQEASRVNRGLDRLSHALGPLGSLYDELYFEYCQRMATPVPDSLDTLRRFPAANVLVDTALAWLSGQGDRPFFLWLHFMDPHAPYYPTSKAIELLGMPQVSPFRARYINSYWNRSDLGAGRLQRHRQEVIDLYDAGIRWVDENLARLAAALRQRGTWEDCLMAVTADHGEEFLERGGRFHPPTFLSEERIRVPLLIRAPRRSGVVSNSAFSLLDLAPTLLDALGASAPREFRGTSRWPRLLSHENWDDPAVAECISGCTNPFDAEKRLASRLLAVRGRRYKLVVDFDRGEDNLFDLEADPRELRPLPQEEQRPARRRLLEVAYSHVTGMIRDRDHDMALRLRLRELPLQWAASDAARFHDVPAAARQNGGH